MAFWKPGTAAPGLGVGAGTLDRETEQESSFVIGNTFKQLSIYQQRVQLPIFSCRAQFSPLYGLILCSHSFLPRFSGEQLLFLVQNFAVTILIGATGSGKTTRANLSFHQSVHAFH
jgi:hypothetical protein